MTYTITLPRAVIEQALEFTEFLWRDVHLNDYASAKLDVVMDTLRAALSQRAPQVAQQAEQGWVLLNDELPQPHQMVLVARGKFVTTGSYSPAFGWEWEELDGEDDDSVATHWMAIPAAPKEKK